MKNLLFRVALKGNGVVNFDDNKQKKMLGLHCGMDISWSYKYYNLSKKSFRKKEGDDKATYNLKISSTCLRHALFEDDYKATNPTISKVDVCMADFISSVPGLLRGYMFTTRGSGKGENAAKGDKGECFVLKSPITLTNAEECTGAIPYLELNSPSGYKPSKENDADKSSTSLYYTENVGDVMYKAKGVIDIKSMQFLSDDLLFGRVAFKDQWLEGDRLLDKVFMNHYGRIPYTEGFFTSTKNVFGERIAEHGVKFDDEFIRFLVCEALKRLRKMSIKRAGAYAEVTSLQIKMVDDGTFDNFESEDGWMEVTPQLIEKLSKELEIDNFYVEASDTLVKKTREEIEKELQKERAKDKAKQNA